MADDQKVDLKSLDIVDYKLEKLKEIFPEVFTENKVDFDKLKLTLGENIEVRKERYGMNWPGKADCFKTIQTPSVATLKPTKEESVDFDTTENLFIEGDNLEVLKLLQRSYFGKVKMIYIDPPYNTGNDFVYPDDYSESLDTYFRYTGQKNGDGKHFSTNIETNGRFHSKWINMMYPRLFLAKNLLKDDGVIFISIDDNELDNLKKICNEIFGEENFIAQFIWKSRQNKDNRNLSGVSIDHEYIISYSKINLSRIIKGQERKTEQYSNPDNDPRGPWASGNMVGILPQNLRPNCHYDLINPITKFNYKKPKMGWRYDKNTMKKLIDENRILWPTSSNGRPRRKVFLNELNNQFTNFSSLIGENIYTRQGTNEIQELFAFKAFDFPKPSILIAELIDQVTEMDDIILDLFAGSATTAHAVLELNKEDKGNRKFIMIQLPEPTDKNSEAYKGGYKNIAQIGEERIRRIIKKIKGESNGKLPLDDKKLDLGFKVFKLDKSNFKIWDGTKKENLKEQLEAFIDHINPKSSQDDILYELILKSGFPLSAKVDVLELSGKKVFSINDASLFICLENEITKELLIGMADKKPIRVICLDAGFQNNDQLKTNAVEIMKIKNVEFRTV